MRFCVGWPRGGEAERSAKTSALVAFSVFRRSFLSCAREGDNETERRPAGSRPLFLPPNPH